MDGIFTEMKKSLIKELDRVFSIYIRNRGASYGYNHCFTCGDYLPVNELQCGHFRNRRYYSTRWHPVNCWPQCNDCNVIRGGNLTRFENKLVAQYGQDAVDGLYELARTPNEFTDEDLRAMIKKYK